MSLGCAGLSPQPQWHDGKSQPSGVRLSQCQQFHVEGTGSSFISAAQRQLFQPGRRQQSPQLARSQPQPAESDRQSRSTSAFGPSHHLRPQTGRPAGRIFAQHRSLRDESQSRPLLQDQDQLTANFLMHYLFVYWNPGGKHPPGFLLRIF